MLGGDPRAGNPPPLLPRGWAGFLPALSGMRLRQGVGWGGSPAAAGIRPPLAGAVCALQPQRAPARSPAQCRLAGRWEPSLGGEMGAGDSPLRHSPSSFWCCREDPRAPGSLLSRGMRAPHPAWLSSTAESPSRAETRGARLCCSRLWSTAGRRGLGQVYQRHGPCSELAWPLRLCCKSPEGETMSQGRQRRNGTSRAPSLFC